MIPVLVVSALLLAVAVAGWARAASRRRRAEAEIEATTRRGAGLDAELAEARAQLDQRRGELEAARAAHDELAAVAAGSEADAGAARAAAAAAGRAAAAAGVPWVDAVWALERLRAERTWRTVAAGGEAGSAGQTPPELLAQALDVELQWMRDVVGTPGRMVGGPPVLDGASAGPAALVALHLAQEVLDVLGKRAEAVEVALQARPDVLEVVVSAVEVELPWDPDGRVGRLGSSVAGVGAEVDVDDGGEGVVVRLRVPVREGGPSAARPAEGAADDAEA